MPTLVELFVEAVFRKTIDEQHADQIIAEFNIFAKGARARIIEHLEAARERGVASGFSDAAGAPVNEIEITPEMTDAGGGALLSSGWPDDCDAFCAANLVYQAMVFAASSHKERSIGAPLNKLNM